MADLVLPARGRSPRERTLDLLETMKASQRHPSQFPVPRLERRRDPKGKRSALERDTGRGKREISSDSEIWHEVGDLDKDRGSEKEEGRGDKGERDCGGAREGDPKERERDWEEREIGLIGFFLWDLMGPGYFRYYKIL